MDAPFVPSAGKAFYQLEGWDKETFESQMADEYSATVLHTSVELDSPFIAFELAMKKANEFLAQDGTELHKIVVIYNNFGKVESWEMEYNYSWPGGKPNPTDLDRIVVVHDNNGNLETWEA